MTAAGFFVSLTLDQLLVEAESLRAKWQDDALTQLRERMEALEEDEYRPTDPSDEDWQGGWDSALYAVFGLIDSA